MGLFKDLRDLSKAGKEIRKQQYGDTRSWTMLRQGVAQAKDVVQELAHRDDLLVANGYVWRGHGPRFP